MLTNRLGSGTSPGTGRFAFEGPQLAGAWLVCLSSAQVGQPARELSCLVLSSPPWTPKLRKCQSTGTARWMGYVRCPGVCFCGSGGGFEDLNGPREPAGPSLAVSARVGF